MRPFGSSRWPRLLQADRMELVLSRPPNSDYYILFDDKIPRRHAMCGNWGKIQRLSNQKLSPRDYEFAFGETTQVGHLYCDPLASRACR